MLPSDTTLYKRRVTLTGRNTTGPQWRAAPWWVTLHMRQCYVRRQTPATITGLPTYHYV